MSWTYTSAVGGTWEEVQPRKGWFDLFRLGQYPTLYPSHKTPVTSDVLEAGLIYAGVILAFSLLLILPGVKKGDRLSAFIRIVIGVFILTSIMVCNFGQEWEVGHIETKTQYRAGLRSEINASVGVKIGLRSVNITLKGKPVVQTFNEGRVNETVNYNERISWDNRGWLVGRGGFGPYAGRYNQEFRELQRKGSPYPILWVAEYFTLDGEGVRWGRHYLLAGYYAHIMLWTALPLWILSAILFKMVIRYGAYFTVMTGLSMLIANMCYASIRNANELGIPFQTDKHETELIRFTWGWSFWLCMATGIIACVIGFLIIVLDHLIPEALSDFFGVDFSQGLEEYYADPAEIAEEQDSSRGRRRTRKQTIVLRSAGRDDSLAAAASRDVEMQEEGVEDIEMQPNSRAYQRNESTQDVQRGYRRRTLFPTHKSQKKNPRPAPPPRPGQAS